MTFFLQFFLFVFLLVLLLSAPFFKCINNITGYLRNVNTFFAIFAVFCLFFIWLGFVNPVLEKKIDKADYAHWLFCFDLNFFYSLIFSYYFFLIILVIVFLSWLLHFNICMNKKNNTIFNIIFYLLDNKCRDSVQ